MELTQNEIYRNQSALTKLKVKAKNLADEARTIRTEERKALAAHPKRGHVVSSRHGNCDMCGIDNGYCGLYSDLREHRVTVVRWEARATQLAIAYIRGKDYHSVEQKCNDKIFLHLHIVPRIVTMVQKYHDRKVTKQMIYEWADVTGPWAKE